MTLSGHADKRPSIVDAHQAVRSFFQQLLPEAHRVSVNRLAQVNPEQGTWEAEAEIWQPNVTIQSRGLATRHPVLDQELYVVHLDGQLNVVDYEAKT
jgi:hypothetical protein